MMDMSRQWVGQVMKRGSPRAGIDPARAHPHAFRHTYGSNCVLRGVPTPVLHKWLGHAIDQGHAAPRRVGRSSPRTG